MLPIMGQGNTTLGGIAIMIPFLCLDHEVIMQANTISRVILLDQLQMDGAGTVFCCCEAQANSHTN